MPSPRALLTSGALIVENTDTSPGIVGPLEGTKEEGREDSVIKEDKEEVKDQLATGNLVTPKDSSSAPRVIGTSEARKPKKALPLISRSKKQ